MTTARDLLTAALHANLLPDAESGERWDCGPDCPEVADFAATPSDAELLRRADEAERLRAALGYIKRHAEGHHSDEDPSVWLHALLVEVPYMVDAALATPATDEARHG